MAAEESLCRFSRSRRMYFMTLRLKEQDLGSEQRFVVLDDQNSSLHTDLLPTDFIAERTTTTPEPEANSLVSFNSPDQLERVELFRRSSAVRPSVSVHEGRLRNCH